MSKNSEKGINDKVNAKSALDTILTEEIGQIGKFQLLNVALSFLVVITIGCAANEYVFTAARINTRCLIPECDSPSPEFSPQWLVNAVPAAGDSFDNCQRFDNSANTTAVVIEGTCPAQLFNVSSLVKCEQYVYKNDDTIVYSFDLGCNDWLRSLVGSIRKLGCLFSLPITGYISDRWGRRTAIVFNAVNTAWLGTVRYWADSYITYVIFMFIEGVCGGALFSCVYILIMELVGPKYRVVMGVTVKTGYSIGQVILAMIAWAVPTWRQLTLTVFVPQFVSLVYFWIFTESILWYLSTGRFKNSEEVLSRIAQFNGKKLSEKSLNVLREAAEQEKNNKELRKEQEASEPWLIVQVFRHKRVLVTCLVSPVWWITGTLIYYGMTINAVGLSGNKYLNYAAVAAAEVPGFWIAALLLDRLGRKPVLIVAYWLCAACQFAYIFTPTDMYALSLALYLVGNSCGAVVMTALYVYTAELYPTKYRHRLFAFSSMVGRLGAIIAPLTPAFAAAVWDKLPFAMFGGFSLLSGFLMFLTPETLGTKLPNTMEEAQHIGNKNNA